MLWSKAKRTSDGDGDNHGGDDGVVKKKMKMSSREVVILEFKVANVGVALILA